MNQDNESLHYRSRFELRPVTEGVSAYDEARGAIWNWVVRKESYRKGWSLSGSLFEPDARRLFFEGGLDVPQDPAASQPRMRVKAISVAGGSEHFWAMDYTEPDSSSQWRRWHTRIGLSSSPDGSCLINVNVGYYMIPEFIAGVTEEALEEPSANVPRIVHDILNVKEYRAYVGETQLLTEACYLEPEGFDDFAAALTDRARELPIVLMATGWDRRTPVWDADDLAYRVQGLANVYVIDWADEAIRDKVASLFKKDTPAYDYRCGAAMLRLYRGHLDLNDPSDVWRHRAFPKDRIDEICTRGDEQDYDALANILNRNLSRGVGRSERDVVDLEDVDRVGARARVVQMRERMERARKEREEAIAAENARARESERTLRSPLRVEKPKASEGRAGDLGHGAVPASENFRPQREIEEELLEWQKYAAGLEKDRDGLKSDVKKWQDFVQDYDNEYDKMSDSLESLSQENEDLARQKSDLEDRLSDKEYLLADANERADAAKQENESLKHAQDVMNGLERLPCDLAGALDLAEQLWGSKIVVLDAAKASAEDYAAGDLDEEWQILQSVATALYDICFDEDGAGDIEKRYRAKAGYELAMTEKGSTKAQSDMMRERSRRYKGQTIDITPHIKGKKKPKRGGVFRLHFYIDNDDQKIVIGHCGDHLTTAGTQKIH